MSNDFHLIDLMAQARAVEATLLGLPEREKIAWLAARGSVSAVAERLPDSAQTYGFESALGLRCAFFFKGEKLVLLGDHTVIKRDSSCSEPTPAV